jgi:hypothetical protein
MLTIELKEDTTEKLLAIIGKPTKILTQPYGYYA